MKTLHNANRTLSLKTKTIATFNHGRTSGQGRTDSTTTGTIITLTALIR